MILYLRHNKNYPYEPPKKAVKVIYTDNTKPIEEQVKLKINPCEGCDCVTCESLIDNTCKDRQTFVCNYNSNKDKCYHYRVYCDGYTRR